eukprot:EG_transcript_8970
MSRAPGPAGPRSGTASAPKIPRTQCLVCGQDGHRSYNCPQKQGNRPVPKALHVAGVTPTPSLQQQTDWSHVEYKVVRPPKGGPATAPTEGAGAAEDDPLAGLMHPSRRPAVPSASLSHKPKAVAGNQCSFCWEEGHRAYFCPYKWQRCCTICGATDHVNTQCAQWETAASRKCTNCGEVGHTALKCKKAREKRCFVCGKSGHSGRKCPDKKCKLCGSNEHLVFNCPNKDQRCLLCGSFAHLTKKCPEDELVKAKGKCMICGLTGHIAKWCPDKKEAPHLQYRPPERIVTACRLCQSLCHKTKDCTAKRDVQCTQCGSTEHEKSQCPSQVCFLCSVVGHHQTNCPEQYKERVYSIENAPPLATAVSLKEALGAYGTVANLEYLGGRFKRFGWCVEFADSKSVQAVLAAEVVMENRRLQFEKGRLESSERIIPLVKPERSVPAANGVSHTVSPAHHPAQPAKPAASALRLKKRRRPATQPGDPLASAVSPGVTAAPGARPKKKKARLAK